MSHSIKLTLVDGSQREYEANTTGLDVAKSISSSLAKKAAAYSLNGKLYDLFSPIEGSGEFELLTRESPQALELIRHDLAHILGQAVQELFPGTQIAIGPVIEHGFYYDFATKRPITIQDLPFIEKKMREIVQRNLPFRKAVWSRQEAVKYFKQRGEEYKLKLIEAIDETQEIRIYSQGDWIDLCRGPHMPATSYAGQAFSLTKLAGAYWRGDSNNPMLTRIYGTAFATQAELDQHLHMLEEAAKRDHRRLGREMDLFHFQEEGPGVVFWHAKGWKIFQNLVSYMRRQLEQHGYDEVNAPQVLDKSLWETSGHWCWYKENMFKVIPAGNDAEDTRTYALKPMNCPGHVQIYKQGIKSYRDLPVRLAEFGNVHRYEPSGALHGLMRVRGFTQDDAHIFCAQEQLAAECLRINDLILAVYKDFGFENIIIKLSTRPVNRVGDDALWDKAEAIMQEVLERIKQQSNGAISTGILPGEGAFYGPKFEYTLQDAIGRHWQCGTTQLDFNLPERFGATYTDSDSQKKHPIMIHRAICGSMERFLGILLENFAGHLPLWFAPQQIVVANVTSEAIEYAETVVAKLKKAGLSAVADTRNEKISYKIREHSAQKIPVILICGKKEAAANSVNMRRLGSPDQIELSLDSAIEQLRSEATPPDLR
ncbi:threonine--tRNA ligase [Bartonella sp. TP]|uniref:threonine--tRNA ligase n=1 Tax=Bartonella sp. TP TaxID=3057550 RepID=UPI0025B12C37|nr:threonine--tRNA ligase [Bartonella sp. TP]WJW79999.1 threonine--tRNA ligase [Bartonella sp. TP]